MFFPTTFVFLRYRSGKFLIFSYPLVVRCWKIDLLVMLNTRDRGKDSIRKGWIHVIHRNENPQIWYLHSGCPEGTWTVDHGLFSFWSSFFPDQNQRLGSLLWRGLGTVNSWTLSPRLPAAKARDLPIVDVTNDLHHHSTFSHSDSPWDREEGKFVRLRGHRDTL